VVGVAVGDPDLADADFGLHRVRLVDDHDPPLRLDLDRRDARRLALLPAAEGALHAGERVGRLHVADHREDGLVRHVLAAVEGDQVVPRQPAHRLHRARRGPAVRVIAEDEALKGGGGDVAGVGLLDLEPAQRLVAPALQLLGREARPQHDVRQQVEPEVELVRGDVDRDEPRLQAGGGVERTAHGVDGLGDLLRRAGLRAFAQQGGGGVGEAGLGRRRVDLAARKQELEAERRRLVLLDDHHPQTVGEGLLLEGGEVDLLGRPRRGRGLLDRGLVLGRRGRARQQHRQDDRGDSHGCFSFSPVEPSAAGFRAAGSMCTTVRFPGLK
jgi:hypothetical protein